MGATTKSRETVQPLKDYREQADKAIRECIARNEPFTVDTVRMLMGVDVKDAHHNVLPAMLARRVQTGQIARIGSVRSPNRSRKGGWNTLWIKA